MALRVWPVPILYCYVEGTESYNESWEVGERSIQHARTVVVTDPLSDLAVLELEANPTRPSHRPHGKQSLAPKVPAPVLVEGGSAEAPADHEPEEGSEMYSPEVLEADAPGEVVPGGVVELRAVRGSSTTETDLRPMLAGGESFLPCSTFLTSSAAEHSDGGGVDGGIGEDWLVVGARASATLCSSSSPSSSSALGWRLVGVALWFHLLRVRQVELGGGLRIAFEQVGHCGGDR